MKDRGLKMSDSRKLSSIISRDSRGLPRRGVDTMQKLSIFLALVSASVAITPTIATAQMNDQKSRVTPPPKVISIGLEEIKHGKAAAHEKNEIAWIQALIRAKYHEFLSLQSLTGSSEVMWLIPFPSYAAYEANYNKSTSAGEFHSIGTQYSAAEADDVSRKTEMLATYREDLSYGAPINLGEYRYLTMATTRVRPGHYSDYVALLSAINDARKSTGGTRVAVYEVTSGAPDCTFLTITPHKSLAELDSTHPTATQERPDVQLKINELSEKAVAATNTQLYMFKPQMSNPSEQTAAADPVFWKPKMTKTKAAVQIDPQPARDSVRR
jgi:hypothetical protein